jgi:hypothetical protein
MKDERIKLRQVGPWEPIEDYLARKKPEDEQPFITPAEDDELVQPKAPGRVTPPMSWDSRKRGHAE